MGNFMMNTNTAYLLHLLFRVLMKGSRKNINTNNKVLVAELLFYDCALEQKEILFLFYFPVG